MDHAANEPAASTLKPVAPLSNGHLRRAAIARALAHLAEATHRDRFATIDRRLMPDRLRVPGEIAALLQLGAHR